MPHDLPATFDAERAVRMARRTLEIEAQALTRLCELQDHRFAAAVQAVLQCTGRVIVMGMGKSGHVGRKIAATLASTGTPAFFVHPGEASHGDLGMVRPQDVVLALSNSGETEEVVAVLPALKRLGVVLIALTGRVESTLASHADHVLSNEVEQEACPLNLAPTALLDARGFREEDFARSHPGGSLGRKLLTHVRDIMRSGDAVPRVSLDTGFSDMMREMSARGIGCTAVVDEAGRPVGVFTDGDLRRMIERGEELRHQQARDMMHPRPRTVAAGALAVEAADLMEKAKIHSVLVVDGDGLLIGALNYNDLLSAKVI